MKKQNLSLIKEYGLLKSGNMIIHGDNHVVCGILHSSLQNQVKCIYIDPPYNNGEEYSYYSDVSSHKKWLYHMRIILSDLFSLLTPDGSIWISIDDKEMHYLKILCDEIFDAKNFIATIVWQHRTTRENRRVFSNNHEYILLYAKNPIAFKNARNLLPMNTETKKRYKNPDNDPRGPWQSVSLNVQSGHAVASQFYTIVSPTGIPHNPPKGRCWIYNEERMLDEIAKGNVWFGADGNSVPRKKNFLKGAKAGLTPETLWCANQVGTTNQAKKHILSLISDIPLFETPKPESLVKRIIEISTGPNDLVLDAFLGSGTTAAVAHKMGRKYIGIDNSSESIHYATERLKKVINGEPGGISESVMWLGGSGFSLYAHKE